MNLFFNTLSVTLGILLPFVAINALFAVYIIARDAINYRTAKMLHDTKAWEKQPPFDDEAEFYKVPNPTMVGVRLKKSGRVVWEGGIDKKGML